MLKPAAAAAILALGMFTAISPSPAQAAMNKADAGIQLAIARARECPKGAALYSGDGQRFAHVVAVKTGPRGYVESVQVRDKLGVVRTIDAVHVYLRGGKLVTDRSAASLAAAGAL